MHYLISLGEVNNSLLAATCLRTLLTSFLLFKHMQIISFSAICALGIQGCITTQMQAKITFPAALSPGTSGGFFHIVPREHPLYRWQSHLGLHSACTGDTEQKQIPRGWSQAHHNTLSWSTAFCGGANIAEKEEPEKIRVADSTPGNITQKYERGAWKKAAVCHHTFFYLILRKDQRAKAPLRPAWLITGASFNVPVKVEVNDVPI